MKASLNAFQIERDIRPDIFVGQSRLQLTTHVLHEHETLTVDERVSDCTLSIQMTPLTM